MCIAVHFVAQYFFSFKSSRSPVPTLAFAGVRVGAAVHANSINPKSIMITCLVLEFYDFDEIRQKECL